MATLPLAHIPERMGRYRILRPLGQGGMGAVYLAQDTELDRQVALKVPHLSAEDGSNVLERFYREARAAATLRHAHICPVFDIGEFQGTPFLTMAYIEGKSLAEVAQTKPPTARQAAILVRKVALALQEAHQRGVIHRDLKPSNIMIDRRGEPVVMDFGLARRVTRNDTRLTQTGAAIGTPAYMPPEQISSTTETVGPACDIYSLGVIFYELLTGRLPFQGDVMAMLAQILTEEPPRPSAVASGVDPYLEAVCLKAMAKKPVDRFGTMQELATQLMTYIQGKSPPPPPQQATATFRPEVVETKPSGIHLSHLGGLRSMAQAGMQMGNPQPLPTAAILKKPRVRKQRLPAWVRMAMGGGAMAFMFVIILLIWMPWGGRPSDAKETNTHIAQNPEANDTRPDQPQPTRSQPTATPKEAPGNVENPVTKGENRPPSGPESPPANPIASPAPSLAALQGEWVVVSEESKGKPTTDADLKKFARRLIFEGEQLTFFRRSVRGEPLFSRGKVDIKGGEIDFHGTDYFDKPRVFRGIFELTGNTLRLAYPNSNAGLTRPTAFVSSAADDTHVLVAQRKTVVAANDAETPNRSTPTTGAPSPRGQGALDGFVALFPSEGVPAGWFVSEWNDFSDPVENVTWRVKDGILYSPRRMGNWLRSERQYSDFILEFEIKLAEGGNSGVALRTPTKGHPAYDGMELQICEYPSSGPTDVTGAIFAALAPRRRVFRPGEWNAFHIEMRGPKLKVTINGEVVQDVDLSQQTQPLKRANGASATPLRARPRRGHIGFQHQGRNNEPVQIRGARIKELK